MVTLQFCVFGLLHLLQGKLLLVPPQWIELAISACLFVVMMHCNVDLIYHFREVTASFSLDMVLENTMAYRMHAFETVIFMASAIKSKSLLLST